MEIFEENGYFLIGTKIRYKIWQEGYHTLINYDLSNLLKIDNLSIIDKFKKDFNAIIDFTCYSIIGTCKLFSKFQNKRDAERALEWAKSIETVNRLVGA